MYRVLLALLETLIVAVFAVVAAGGASAQSAASERDDPPNLTGAWTLNEDLSDDPAQVMETMKGGDHGASGRGGFGGHGPGMHGGGGMGGGRGGMDREQMRARMSLLEPPGRLTITQTDGSITLTDGDGRSQTLATNNAKERQPFENGTVDVKTKWDDGRLVKATSLEEGLKLTETYSLDPNVGQLNVLVKLEGSHLPRAVTLRRVYDSDNPQ